MLERVDQWGAEHAAVAVVSAEGVLGEHGDDSHVFRWLSVTKLVTAVAALVAAEEGIIELDEPAGPAGSTVRHLLAHASGLPFDGPEPIARPGERRIYSNSGFETLGDFVASRAEMPFSEYLGDAVLRPLAMEGSVLEGSPAQALRGPLRDLIAFAHELFAPRLLAPETLAEATSVQFPGLVGVIPGLGRQDPNDWGLGFELRDLKSPHWTGSKNSPRTYGHFGGSGTFLWLDPDAGLACSCLTDREFDSWALDAWPAFSDSVLDEFSRP